jgi:hypothetical protein
MVRRNLAGMFLVIALLPSSVDHVSAQAAPKPKAAPRKPAVPSKPPPKLAAPAPVPAAPPPPPSTDVQLRTKFTTGAQVSENRTYIQGARQRFEFPGLTMITQCDQKRTFQIHDGTKRYMVTPIADPPPAAIAPSEPSAPDTAAPTPTSAKGIRNPLAKPKGGVITQTTTLTDTGERKQLFGLDARHIKTVVTRQPDATACETKAAMVETDGWYADLPEHASCASLPVPEPPAAAAPPACVDRVVTQESGEAKLGFALSTIITTTVADAKNKDKDKDVTTMSMEIADLAVTSLDKALFDLPAGYVEVKDYPSLLPSLAAGGSVGDAVFGSLASGTNTVAPKKSGVVRIGIATPTNRSGQEMPDLRLVGSLLAGFTKAPFEALPLSGTTAADLDRDCVAKACDYVLVSDIAEIKTTKPNRVGGVLKKVSGDANGPSEIHQVRVDYKLFAAGDSARARTTSSATASSGGGFGVGSALKLASYAGQMYLTMGMGSGMLMGMAGPGMGGLGGGFAGGVSSGRLNPGMNAAMSILSAATAPSATGGADEASADRAADTVLDGLAKASKQVADELKKAKK